MRDSNNQHDPIRNKLLNSLFGNFSSSSSSCERPHNHHRHSHSHVDYTDNDYYHDDQDYYYYEEEEAVEQEQQPQQLQSSCRTRYEKRLPTIPEHHHPEHDTGHNTTVSLKGAATPSSPTSVTKSLHLLVEIEEDPEQDEALCSYGYNNINGDDYYDHDYYDHDFEYERYEPDMDRASDDVDHDDEEPEESTLPSRKKRVSFQSSDKNTIILIPSFRDYTQEECSRMWNSRSEIKRAIHRNVVEFVREGWDWRQALEEDQFLRLDNGELVHPAHVPNDGNNNHHLSSSSSLAACHHHHHHATHHHHHDQHQHHSKHCKHHYNATNRTTHTTNNKSSPPPSSPRRHHHQHQHPCLPVFPTMVVTPISKPTSGGGGVTVDNAS